MASLNKINFWGLRVDWSPVHSAQSILQKSTKGGKRSAMAETSCGSGECNCGGGCNGECGSCH